MSRIGFANLGNPYLIGILLTVHLLDEQLVASRNELHARDVVVACVTRDIDPCSCTTISRYITHLYGRVGSTCLRIREAMDSRIDGIYIINNIEPTGTIGIALPISNVLAVRTPTETVTATELFFVHPVEGTVHNLLTTVLGYLNHRTVCNGFYIDVVLRNVCHLCAVGRKLGKHQGSFRTSLAQLLQLACLDIQHPIIATGIHAPYPTGIGINQYLIVVFTENKATDTDRFSGFRIHQLVGRNKYFLRIVLGIVSHDIETTGSILFYLGIMLTVFHPINGPTSFGSNQASVYGFFQSRNVLCLYNQSHTPQTKCDNKSVLLHFSIDL